MRKIQLAGAAGGLFMLSACAAGTSTIITDTQSALVDGQALLVGLEAGGKLTGQQAAIATEVISGLAALVSAESAAKGASAELQAIAVAQAAVAQVQADLPANATVRSATGAATTALAALSATSTGSAKAQAEAAVVAVMFDYLAAQGGTQAAADHVARR